MQLIHNLQNEHDVKIECKNATINVSGYKEDVTTVIESIQTLLLSTLKDIKSAEITEKIVQWSKKLSVNNKPFVVKYPIDINHKLETAYENKQLILKINVNNRVIVFDLRDSENMCEYPENNKANSIKVLRKDLIKSGMNYFNTFMKCFNNYNLACSQGNIVVALVI